MIMARALSRSIGLRKGSSLRRTGIAHEQTHLADGNVYGHEIECPRHLGAFDYRTGEAVMAPACIDLKTFNVRVEDEAILIEI